MSNEPLLPPAWAALIASSDPAGTVTLAPPELQIVPANGITQVRAVGSPLTRS